MIIVKTITNEYNFALNNPYWVDMPLNKHNQTKEMGTNLLWITPITPKSTPTWNGSTCYVLICI